MKFTEGYWLRSERAEAQYASQAYEMQPVEGGMQVLCPFRRIESRAQTLDIGALTLTFRAVGHNAVTVRICHHAGYDTHAPRFETHEQAREVTRTETEDAYVMAFDDLTVRVKKDSADYTFESNGRVITGSGFRNTGYVLWDRPHASMRPDDRYLREKDGKNYVVSELQLDVDESVYGFGERFSAFAKNGQSIETWNEDGGTASQIAYKSIPFYMSNKGYGVFVNNTGNVSFEVASEKVEYVGFSVEGEALEYTFFYGPDLHDVLSAYTALTGRPALPPAWSFGLWLSTSFTTSYDEGTTGSMIQGMADREIPLSVFHFDCYWMHEFHWCDLEWDPAVFPDPEGMLARYHDRGLKVCAWINPYVAQHTEAFREGMEHGYFLQRADGRGVWQTDHWQYGLAVVDFTNPGARAWYQQKLRRLLRQGVDCLKTDFGERIPIDVTYFDGSDPVAMHNYYTYVYNRAVFEVLEEEKGAGEAVMFMRSATVGSQQFPLCWGGDCMATYPSMAETLRGGLSFAMSGFSYWSHDISGFESTATPDLYKRWAAFGLLSSHSRLHGSTSYRVPWLFDDEASEVVRAFTQLKCRLMPYLFEVAVQAHETGVPMMRPMVMEFREDPACRYLDRQYMLGPDLLVVPVLRADGTADFYLPEGTWVDYFTGEKKEGGRWYSGSYDYFRLPLYVRGNVLLAEGRIEDRPDYDYAGNLRLRYFAPEEGKEASCRIVDVKGRTVGTITAVMKDGQLQVWEDAPEAAAGGGSHADANGVEIV